MKFVLSIPLGRAHSKWPWAWASVSPLGEEYRGSWAPSVEHFLNGDVTPLGVNFGKQIFVSMSPHYLNSWSFDWETNLLGFELDLLIHMFLAWAILWKTLRRHSWYLQIYLIWISYSSTWICARSPSYPDTPRLTPGNSEHQVRRIRTQTQSLQTFWLLILFQNVLSFRFIYSLPLGI